ncbi:MAG: hypothetical protein EBR95_02395 [Verrucomicrobia bacterium]|nr:hypothetical protein [Verrucomicrobiota bacterium]
MDADVIFKLLLAAGGFAVWAYQQMKAKSEQPAPSAMAAPPPLPRRARKPRAPKPAAKASEEPAEGAARPALAPHLDSTNLVVTRPARAQSRTQFRGAAALRQAIVAREVLGPPLCLRPPRF